MTVNPYTLNMLYQNGILDYVPTELIMPVPHARYENMVNPYAQIVREYKNYPKDSFNYAENRTEAVKEKPISKIKKMFGFDKTGEKSTASSIYGENGIGEETKINPETVNGGFGDFKNNLKQTTAKTFNTIFSFPKVLIGLASLGLVILTGRAFFKGTGFKGMWKDIKSLNPFKRH